MSLSNKVVEYGHSVVKVQITEKQLKFKENGEVTVPDFSPQGASNHSNNNLENLEIKRRVDKNDLHLETFLYKLLGVYNDFQ